MLNVPRLFRFICLSIFLVAFGCLSRDDGKAHNEALHRVACLAASLKTYLGVHGVEKTQSSLPSVMDELWRKDNLDVPYDPGSGRTFTKLADYRASIVTDGKIVRVRVTCTRLDIRAQGGGEVFSEMEVPENKLPANGN